MPIGARGRIGAGRGRLGAKLVAVVTAAALGACAGGGGTLSTGSLQVSLGHIKTQKSDRLFASAPEPSSSTLSHAAGGFGVIRDDQAEAYLKGIVARLLEHWHGDKPERVGIFIVSGDSMRAKATPSGDILIPIGAFDEIENEDQLAALIGHELGHIVLRHHEDEKQAKQLAEAGAFAVALVFGASSVRNGGMRKYGRTREFYIKDPRAVERDTMRAFGAQVSFVTLTQDILLTAYSRDQEYTADVFGTRLAGNAGWDHRAILALVQKWHDAEETEKQQQEKMMQSAGIVGGPLMAVGQAAASLIATHPSAESRRENIVKDMQAAFPNSDPKPPSEADYRRLVQGGELGKKRKVWQALRKAMKLMSDGKYEEAAAIVRGVQKQPGAMHPDSRLVMANAIEGFAGPSAEEDGFKFLASADLRQPASRVFYDKLATKYAWRRQYGEAAKVLDVGERYYGRPTMLPSRIGLLRIEMMHAVGTSNQPPPMHLSHKSGELMAACRATGDSDLVEECTAMATGVSTEKQYETCGGVITALTAFAPGGNTRCGNQTNDKAAAPGVAAAPAQQGSPVTQLLGSVLGLPK